jgi:hypothetical protein
MKTEQDPLASHIFVSRRHYRNVADTKSGKRREMIARLSFNTACELGFRGSLDEWERIGDEIKVAFGFSQTYFVFVRAG